MSSTGACGWPLIVLPVTGTSTRSARLVASLRLVGVTVVLAAGIAGFATISGGTDAAPVQLDLAVVTTDAGS